MHPLSRQEAMSLRLRRKAWAREQKEKDICSGVLEAPKEAVAVDIRSRVHADRMAAELIQEEACEREQEAKKAERRRRKRERKRQKDALQQQLNEEKQRLSKYNTDLRIGQAVAGLTFLLLSFTEAQEEEERAKSVRAALDAKEKPPEANGKPKKHKVQKPKNEKAASQPSTQTSSPLLEETEPKEAPENDPAFIEYVPQIFV